MDEANERIRKAIEGIQPLNQEHEDVLEIHRKGHEKTAPMYDRLREAIEAKVTGRGDREGRRHEQELQREEWKRYLDSVACELDLQSELIGRISGADRV